MSSCSDRQTRQLSITHSLTDLVTNTSTTGRDGSGCSIIATGYSRRTLASQSQYTGQPRRLYAHCRRSPFLYVGMARGISIVWTPLSAQKFRRKLPVLGIASLRLWQLPGGGPVNKVYTLHLVYREPLKYWSYFPTTTTNVCSNITKAPHNNIEPVFSL